MRGVNLDEIKQALATGEIIEDYPNDIQRATGDIHARVDGKFTSLKMFPRESALKPASNCFLLRRMKRFSS